ncbi:MAG: Hpt domain-containing protein, partial [Proteobacteria bacterium]|nr:Hpt domain-containing protein [Pseudomonadota bacterium]
MQLITIPDQTAYSEIDEEIIEIFVEEVEEVLEEIVNSFESWQNDPDDSEALATLRRNFHTLKGSGRMVNATAIGELGWEFENMFNQVINGILARNDDMLMLTGKVEKILPAMIEQFQQAQSAPYEVLLLISQTKYFTENKGQGLGEFEPNSATTVEPSNDIPEPNNIDKTIELKPENLEVEDFESEDFEPENILDEND